MIKVFAVPSCPQVPYANAMLDAMLMSFPDIKIRPTDHPHHAISLYDAFWGPFGPFRIHMLNVHICCRIQKYPHPQRPCAVCVTLIVQENPVDMIQEACFRARINPGSCFAYVLALVESSRPSFGRPFARRRPMNQR